MNFFNNEDTTVFALGGLGEVGKNMYCLMHANEIIIIDAGVIFPEDSLMGIDLVIQDFTFLKRHESKIKALFITHGHEDHIGAIPYLIQSLNIPFIYAPNHAVGLIKKKITEKNIPYKNIVVYTDNNKFKFKNFEVGFFKTTHSIPDSHGIYINTPNGTVVTSGDFKMDLTPIGPDADLAKMAEIGSKGVTLLLSDSTNALDPGVSNSESKVDMALNEPIANHKGRIIIATFASNIYRLKHIIETCKKHDRKVVVFGRSMLNNIEISVQGGYITNKGTLIKVEEANNYPPEKLCFICTGSQGEPLAVLTRLADGSHRQIKLLPNDLVIFSSSTIPGNNLSVSRIINKLYLKGIEVLTNSAASDIHASGHGNQEELKLMLKLIKPTYFMPVHGEYLMLKKHADLAVECGIPKDNCFIMDNGEVLALRKGTVIKTGTVPTGDVFVDGNRIGDIGGAVIKDRKIMANDGIVVVIVNVDTKTNKLLLSPNITTRGFVLNNDNMDLLKKLEGIAEKAILNKLGDRLNYTEIKNQIIEDLNIYIEKETGRKPIILPVIMDVKRNQVKTENLKTA